LIESTDGYTGRAARCWYGKRLLDDGFLVGSFLFIDFFTKSRGVLKNDLVNGGR
jgi:hypothetical protein